MCFPGAGLAAAKLPIGGADRTCGDAVRLSFRKAGRRRTVPAQARFLPCSLADHSGQGGFPCLGPPSQAVFVNSFPMYGELVETKNFPLFEVNSRDTTVIGPLTATPIPAVTNITQMRQMMAA